MTNPSESCARSHVRSWILLFGALSASAGHGLFLYLALTRKSWIPDLRQVLGKSGALDAAAVSWFLAAVPLALLALASRRALQGRRWLPLLAGGVAAVAVSAFWKYSAMMLAAPPA